MTLSDISLINPEPDKLWQDRAAKSVSFFCRRRPVRIDRHVITELKELAKAHDGKNVRLCLHEGPEADHHDMVILEHRGKYYRPHKHDRKGEAFHIIEGRMGIFAFDEAGVVTDAAVLEPSDIYRVEEGSYHAVLPVSEWVIYHENKPGPFAGDGDSIFPGWAPDGSDAEAVTVYVNQLEAQLSGEVLRD